MFCGNGNCGNSYLWIILILILLFSCGGSCGCGNCIGNGDCCGSNNGCC